MNGFEDPRHVMRDICVHSRNVKLTTARNADRDDPEDEIARFLLRCAEDTFYGRTSGITCPEERESVSTAASLSE